MTSTRLSHYALAAAVSAALLAGCSAGSQFSPPSGSAGSQTVALQQAGDQGVSPDSFMVTGYFIIGNQLYWYYINIWNQIKWGKVPKTYSNGSTLGGSLGHANQVDVATTDDTIDIYTGKKLVTTLTGLKAVATGLETDSHGNTFAAVNAGSQTLVNEFAPGSTTPTATYSDPNLQSVASLGIDKAGRVYVEGQSQAGSIEVDEMAGSGSFKSLAPAGSLGVTAGGLAVQTSGKATYLWINDRGNASDPANITRYELTGTSLVKESSFDYAGVNGGIAADPTGKDTTDVYAVNNVAAGSEYTVTAIKYSYPSGQIESQTPAQTSSQESLGISVK